MTPRLNRKLVLETPIRASDGSGGFVETWTELGALWAEVTPRTGRERSEQGAVVSSTGYRVTVRAAPFGEDHRPRPEQRFRDGARVYVIQSVTERDPAGRFLTCIAEEEVAT